MHKLHADSFFLLRVLWIICDLHLHQCSTSHLICIRCTDNEQWATCWVTEQAAPQQLTWTTINNQLLSISINHTLLNGSLFGREPLSYNRTHLHSQKQSTAKSNNKQHVSIMMVLKFFNSLNDCCYYGLFVAVHPQLKSRYLRPVCRVKCFGQQKIAIPSKWTLIKFSLKFYDFLHDLHSISNWACALTTMQYERTLVCDFFFCIYKKCLIALNAINR